MVTTCLSKLERPGPSCVPDWLRAGVIYLALSLVFLTAGCTSTMAPAAATGGGNSNLSGESAAHTEEMAGVIFVVPLQGASLRTALVLADAIAAEIRDTNHPAILAYEPNQAGASVVGHVVSAEERGKVSWLTIEWAIRAPYGTHVARFRQQAVIDTALWTQGAPEAINLIVADAAPKIAEMVNTQVGPPLMDAMKRPSAAPRDGPAPAHPSIPNPSPQIPPADGGVETAAAPRQQMAAPTPVQPLARISDRTNGQVLHAPGAPVPPPDQPAPPPSVLPSLVEQGPVGLPGTAKASSGSPQPLSPDAMVGKSTTAAKDDPEKSTSFLEALVPSMSTDTHRPGDARPAGAGGAAFAEVRWGQPSFLIRPVKGAPGNGNEALTAALKTALRDRDLTISEDPRQAGFIIQGEVDMGEPASGRQYVRITWQVNTVTGENVGKAVQENTIVAGSLDGEWGHVAEVVSHAAVRGIKDLFGEADDRTRDRERLPDFPDVKLPAEPGRAPPPPSSY